MRRNLRLALLAACTTACSIGCSTTGPYPNDPQERHYQANRDAVYHAMVRACRLEGFDIHVAEPHRLRVEARAGERVVILQGVEKADGVTVRIGMVRAEARDFARLWSRLDAELES